ncbi:MAG: hypothetical protein GY784_13800 [Gammaproteobacteria bacterium]|nr:hypothetical protein [Gammaproteobacteria bacterium]
MGLGIDLRPKMNFKPDLYVRVAVLQVYLLSQAQRREIPSFLIDLSPRIHENVEYQNRIYHVAVADIGDDRLFIAFDISEIKKHKQELTFVLTIAGVVAPFLMLIIAVRYINRVVKPVSAIAQEVSALNPDQRNVRMTGNYKGNEVKQIAGAINQYIERLDGFVEREQMFTAAVSHELRTPIVVIQTPVELAEKFNSEASPSRVISTH